MESSIKHILNPPLSSAPNKVGCSGFNRYKFKVSIFLYTNQGGTTGFGPFTGCEAFFIVKREYQRNTLNTEDVKSFAQSTYQLKSI